jgi:dolichol kinase
LYPKNAIVLGALVLAFGDPVATLAGKRFGKRRLFRDKTIAGSAGFFAAALIIGVTFLGAVSPELGPVHIALTATLAATAGTVIELFGEVVEDNLTIPLLVGGVVALLL